MSGTGAFVIGCVTGGAIVFLSIFFGWTIAMCYVEEWNKRRNND